MRLRTWQWRRFVDDVAAGEDTWLLECCLVQNPLTVTLLRDDAPPSAAVDLVRSLAAIAEPLDPVVVALRPDDVGAAFRAAAAERPDWWLDHVVAYYAGRGLGRRLGVELDLDGAIRVARERAAVENHVLDELAAGGVPVVRLPVERDGPPYLSPALSALADGLTRPA